MGLFDISRSNNYYSKINRKCDCLIYRKWDCLIFLARVITRARYMKKIRKWYISHKLIPEQDISEMGLFDISHSNNYSSEIYRKLDCLIYLAQVISRAKYIKNGFGWFISLGLFLERDISKMDLVDISRLSNYSSEIYQK